MSTICTIAQLRTLVNSSLTDEQLQFVLDDEDAQMREKLGDHADGAISVIEQVMPRDGQLFLSRVIASVVSVVNDGGTTVAPSDYHVCAAQGRIEARAGAWSDAPFTVTYLPVSDMAKRRRALIDLVRLRLERTVMKSESVAGEYSYAAPDNWQVEQARIYRTLIFMEI